MDGHPRTSQRSPRDEHPHPQHDDARMRHRPARRPRRPRRARRVVAEPGHNDYLLVRRAAVRAGRPEGGGGRGRGKHCRHGPERARRRVSSRRRELERPGPGEKYCLPETSGHSLHDGQLVYLPQRLRYLLAAVRASQHAASARYRIVEHRSGRRRHNRPVRGFLYCRRSHLLGQQLRPQLLIRASQRSSRDEHPHPQHDDARMRHRPARRPRRPRRARRVVAEPGHNDYLLVRRAAVRAGRPEGGGGRGRGKHAAWARTCSSAGIKQTPGT